MLNTILEAWKDSVGSFVLVLTTVCFILSVWLTKRLGDNRSFSLFGGSPIAANKLVRVRDALLDAMPALGLIGTVVGVSGSLGEMDDLVVLTRRFSVALVTTLWGLFGFVVGSILRAMMDPTEEGKVASDVGSPDDAPGGRDQ